jgi:hypothetical protein
MHISYILFEYSKYWFFSDDDIGSLANVYKILDYAPNKKI